MIETLVEVDLKWTCGYRYEIRRLQSVFEALPSLEAIYGDICKRTKICIAQSDARQFAKLCIEWPLQTQFQRLSQTRAIAAEETRYQWAVGRSTDDMLQMLAAAIDGGKGKVLRNLSAFYDRCDSKIKRAHINADYYAKSYENPVLNYISFVP